MLYKTNKECFHWVKDEMFYSTFNSFDSLNRTFHLSPHVHICIIALKTIHYLYNMSILVYVGYN